MTAVAPTGAPPAALVTSLIAGRPRRWAVEAATVLAGVAVIGLLAQVYVPMAPVPITGQTLGVLLIGAAYGARRGAITLLAYAIAGLAGIPVFAGFSAGIATVVSPSFGFILGFIPAAWLAGRLADRGWDRSVGRCAVAVAAATIVPFVIGVPYMCAVLAAAGHAPTASEALAWGVWPFLPGGAIKAAIAAIALPTAWRIRRSLGSDDRTDRS